jgi:hypothetical protein
VGPDGSFTAEVTWDTPVEGLYNMVLDVNGDSVFNKNDGDFANQDNQIDFIVGHGRDGHNDVVTLGDNGRVRELFTGDRVQNVYALGRNLPPNDSVNAWVVSARLLPAGFSWSSPGALDLASVSIPVLTPHGPILVGQLTTADKVRAVPTSPEGSLFAAVWEQPYELMNTTVFTARPAVPDYKPEYAEEDSIQDPCENAWKSDDTNFQAVCNVGNLFSDYYGNSFNVVLDVNRNGVFDAGDRVDTHDIGDLTAFFAASPDTVLDARANGSPAVGEYKEYLDAKLNLSLPHDDVYDEALQRASAQYMCSPVLSGGSFSLVQQGAQVGFKMLNAADYLNESVLSSGLYNYAAVDMNDATVPAGASTCVTTEKATIANQTVQPNAAPTVVSDHIEMQGTNTVADNSTSCMVAKAMTFTEGFALTVALLDPEPISKTIFAVLGAGALATQAVLGVCAGAI